MASHQPSRAASIAERRASVRQNRNRPTSATNPSPTADPAAATRSSLHTRKTSTTTDTTRREALTRETLIKRTTISPVKPPERNANLRRSVESERQASVAREKAPVRNRGDSGAGM